MKRSRTSRTVLAGLTALAALTTLSAFAQTPPPAPKGWQFAGVWAAMGPPNRLNTDPVFTPKGKEEADRETRLRESGDLGAVKSKRCNVADGVRGVKHVYTRQQVRKVAAAYNPRKAEYKAVRAALLAA